MNISDFKPSTIKPSISSVAPLSSDELKSFSEAAVNDLNSLSILLNDYIVKIFKTLPDTTGQNALTNGFDGKAFYVDGTSTNDIDNGLFYHQDEARPLSVYESLLMVIQIIANIENGLREGVRVGSVSAPIQLTDGSFVEYEWPYFDGAFQASLFSISAGVITQNTALTITVDYNQKKIILTNNSGITQEVYGFLWHPVFSF